MSVLRRRYYFWLIRAYVGRWGKTILTSLAFGVVAFFIFLFILNFYIFPLFEKKVEKLGYVGAYSVHNVPQNILSDASYGLTKVNKDGSISGAGAYKWDVKDSGKTYIFYIKRGQYFSNNRELTSKTLPLNFADVKRQDIDDYTIKFSLKTPYSPFLTAVSAPIILKDLSGLGNFKINKLDLNGGYIKTMILNGKNDSSRRKIIKFYPTQEALRIAYSLGEIDKAYGLSETQIKNTKYSAWPNTSVDKDVDYADLVTVFYNNSDSILSDKKVRQALNYALPAIFEEGERAYSPIPPNSLYFSRGPNYGISDPRLSESLIGQDKDIKNKTFEITTSEEYKEVAEKVVASWEKIGIKSSIKITIGIPRNFQIFIYPIKLPEDPDQYTIWHSKGTNNIINYKTNKRIDKLLEDGRSTSDIEVRKNIYSDFQKYLVDDAPASFLYFPYSYSLKRN